MRTLLFIVFVIAGTCFRTAAQNPASDLAKSMAQKMKDSLQLSDKQKDALYAINMRLHFQKMNMRRIYTSEDSLQYHFQKIENTRDSLYSTVITREKYLQYQQKKRKLISRN